MRYCVFLRTKEAVGSVDHFRWVGATILGEPGHRLEIGKRRYSNSERNEEVGIGIEAWNSSFGRAHHGLRPWCNPSASDLP